MKRLDIDNEQGLPCLGLTERTINALGFYGIIYVSQLKELKDHEILAANGLGKTALAEIKKSLEDFDNGILHSGKLARDPTEEEITRRRDEIKKDWSEAEYRRRAGNPQKREDETWLPPSIDTTALDN